MDSATTLFQSLASTTRFQNELKETLPDSSCNHETFGIDGQQLRHHASYSGAWGKV